MPHNSKPPAGRPKKRKSAPVSRETLGREDWILAAQKELISGGINAVKVERLARRLRVTRGSFYWHFTGHGDLLRELLKSWERTNTEPFERALTGNGAPHGMKEFIAVIHLWIDETDYSPPFDTAVRDWARTSREAAAAVRSADERRIAVLHRIFLDIGFADPEALIRARVTYFHQVGYYALAIREDQETRRKLVPLYCQVLLGSSEELVQTAFTAPA
jgi:AcrR family transcriptional regulator